MADLIVTNGDNAAGLLRATGRANAVLPWNDVLYEGPIAATALAECSRRRVDYLTRRFRLDHAEVVAEFTARDAVLMAHKDFPSIELWFEHDLYDQLQLVQILAFFAAEQRTAGLTLVQADDYLGAQAPDTILKFAQRERPVDEADLALAARLWAQLAEPTPQPVADGLADLDGRLPFLRPALIRLLEELPSPRNGLGRTEQTVLATIAGGTVKPLRLFPEVTRQEEATFMGDWSLFRMLDDLASCDEPLIAGLAPRGPPELEAERMHDATLELTETGRAVLAGTTDHVAVNGLDRWWAGTHLFGRAVWRYDRDQSRLVPPAHSDA